MKKMFVSMMAVAMSLCSFASNTITITLNGDNGNPNYESSVVLVEDANRNATYEAGYDAECLSTDPSGILGVMLYGFVGTRKCEFIYSDNLEGIEFGFTSNVTETQYHLYISANFTNSYQLYDAVADEYIALDGSVTDYPFTAVAGRVNVENRFYIYDPTPDYGSYQRDVTAGNYGTICLPKDGTIAGGTLFNIGSYENNMIYIDEVGSVEIEAGKPYIFEASADQIIVTYTSDVVVNDAGNANGLFGNYDLTDETAIFNVPVGDYILYNNLYWEVVSARPAKLYNYFAYIKIDQIINNAPAPGRRRVGMAVNNAQTTTGMDELNAVEAPVKTVIDGKMYIIRGEHMFDATGRMVK